MAVFQKSRKPIDMAGTTVLRTLWIHGYNTAWYLLFSVETNFSEDVNLPLGHLGLWISSLDLLLLKNIYVTFIQIKNAVVKL